MSLLDEGLSLLVPRLVERESGLLEAMRTCNRRSVSVPALGEGVTKVPVELLANRLLSLDESMGEKLFPS